MTKTEYIAKILDKDANHALRVAMDDGERRALGLLGQLEGLSTENDKRLQALLAERQHLEDALRHTERAQLITQARASALADVLWASYEERVVRFEKPADEPVIDLDAFAAAAKDSPPAA